jgi:hypothetical protein
MLPNYWRRFVEVNALRGASFSFEAQHDESGVGADLQILTDEQSYDEATNFWPGIGVAKDDYVPVASCLSGSGDYYYINTNDGPNGRLYRIYHDSVGENGYNPDEAIAVVLTQYEQLLAYREA